MDQATARISAAALITPAGLAQFQDQGYLVVEDLFDAETDLGNPEVAVEGIVILGTRQSIRVQNSDHAWIKSRGLKAS